MTKIQENEISSEIARAFDAFILLYQTAIPTEHTRQQIKENPKIIPYTMIVSNEHLNQMFYHLSNAHKIIGGHNGN